MKKLFMYLTIIIIIAILLVLAINEYIKSTTTSRIVNSNLNDVDCIIILGAGLRNNGPSPMLEDRLEKGIELYNNGISNKILMSGDHSTDIHDEVNIMKTYAINKGIPSSNIFMDHAGISTYDSIYRAKHIFKAKKIVIVTQKYHLYRALYIAEKLGIDAYGVETNPIEYRGDTYRNIREIIARTKDFIKCLYKPQSTYLGNIIPITGNGDDTNDK